MPPAARREHRTDSISIAAEINSARDEAVIAANRAKLAELRAHPYTMVPDFPDALRSSVAWAAAPRMGSSLAALALQTAGLVHDPVALGAVSGLPYIVSWLAQHGYVPEKFQPAAPPLPLFSMNPALLAAWYMLDWIQRCRAAADVNDDQLEDELDAYYPRWSRTDFEWDIRRIGPGPLLNPDPDWYGGPDDLDEAPLKHPTLLWVPRQQADRPRAVRPVLARRSRPPEPRWGTPAQAKGIDRLRGGRGPPHTSRSPASSRSPR